MVNSMSMFFFSCFFYEDFETKLPMICGNIFPHKIEGPSLLYQKLRVIATISVQLQRFSVFFHVSPAEKSRVCCFYCKQGQSITNLCTF